MVPAPDSPVDSDAGAGPNSSPSRRRSGSPFRRHVGRVTGRFDELLPFALVPLALSLLQFEQVARALDGARGLSLNFELRLPSPLHHLWSFVDPPGPAASGPTRSPAPGSSDGFPFGESSPDAGGTDGFGPGTGAGSGISTDVTIETPLETIVVPVDGVGSETIAWIGLALLVYAVLSAVLAAGYLGGMDRRLRGEPAAIRHCLVRYTPRLLLYHLVVFGAFLAVVPVLLLVSVDPRLFLLALPLVLVLGYLFYAAPFLLVVADIGVLEAFRRSYGYALEGGAYFWFALGHVVAAAVVSAVLSALVSAGGPGVVLALVVVVPFSLVLTAATVSLCQELVARDGGSTGAAASRSESFAR